jgi:hypothetical protein
VAPFKAENMSNHSPEAERQRTQPGGGERAGLETLTAREYYAHADALRPIVRAACDELASRFDAVVIEGAGSVFELNLRAHDLVNPGLVVSLQSPWILVADIERGGMFGSIVGSVHLLTPTERALFRGFAINKFRGDRSLFDEGVRLLEAQTGSRRIGPRCPRTCCGLCGAVWHRGAAHVDKALQYEHLADWFEGHGRDLGALGFA